MSLYPCDVHGQRVPGALNGFYPAVLVGSDRYSRRMRLCTLDLDQILSTYRDEWVTADDDDQVLESDVCAHCHERLERPGGSAAFFATAYRKGEERADFFAAYCLRCADRLVSYLGLDK